MSMNEWHLLLHLTCHDAAAIVDVDSQHNADPATMKTCSLIRTVHDDGDDDDKIVDVSVRIIEDAKLY